jgi:predicted nucleic acid-binding protein
VVRDGGEDVVRAARLALEHGLSFWDAMIVAAAASARCTVLYSEDLQNGWRFADLRVVNPFD